jgi:hypothetical protein
MNMATDLDEKREPAPAARPAPRQRSHPGTDLVGSETQRAVSHGRRRSPNAAMQRWSRTLHVYTSMICLLVVLFFSLTGLTLNHPSWSLFGGPTRSSVTGTLPGAFRTASGIDWLVVAEHLRDEEGAHGSVTDRRSDDQGGSISFRGPGYAADAFFRTDDGTYEMTIEAQGLLGVMNDLHKGRDTGGGWRWLIDASAVFLVMVSVTGLVLQLVLRKRRRSAMGAAATGAVLFLLAVWLTISR